MTEVNWGPAQAQRDIDWTRPWLKPLASLGQAVLADWQASGSPLFESLNRVLDVPVTFVDQDALGPQLPYEAHVSKHGQVPTRENLHDFFNAMSWAIWPRAKTQFNRLHASALAASVGEAKQRGPVRDALTLLDENGAVLVAPARLWRALRAHDWQTAFLTARSDWQSARLWLVGHALMQQLTQPRKGLTAHVWLMNEDLNAWACERLAQGRAGECVRTEIDEEWAKTVTAETLALKPFTPLPVLGVPGWWDENVNPAFYLDTQVFRPKRFPK
jgi:hypothetical protein